ncbi:unnamed protein product [Lupinus luteus]|uniref:Chromo domain-containing protein n=1 Tax=Lupinus luteus TaxID=3873 RepID=A0AAV1Y1N5_LUPLU
MEKIRMVRENMKTTQSRQKSYYDKRRNPLNFEEAQLRKYISDLSHIIEPNSIQLKDNLTFETLPIKIGDRSVKTLRGKEIALVKVIWNQANGEDATWEVEDAIRESYPYLFE